MTKSIFSRRYEKFCQLLVQARTEKGLTQADLAKRLRKPQSYVSKYEGGERRLDVIEFLEVIKALGITSAVILQDIEDRNF